MTTFLRSLLVISAVALGLGLALHLVGWAIGDRLIVGGLIVLVMTPIANVAVAVGEEITRARRTRNR